MDAELIHRERRHRVALGKGEGAVTGSIDDRPIEVAITRLTENAVTVEYGGASYRAFVARSDAKVYVHIAGRVFVFDEAGARLDESSAGAAAVPAGDSVSSSMPGKVVQVLVTEGDEVEEGRPLVIVEAMKMETPLPSPRAGRVRKVNFVAGDLVDAGRPIVELEEE